MGSAGQLTFPTVHPQDSGIEPDADQSQCTHCSSAIGTPHATDCTAVRKTVLVKYYFEIEVSVPHFWTAEQIEDSDNFGCANDALEELQEETGVDCLCSGFSCEFVAEVDGEPRVVVNEPDRGAN